MPVQNCPITITFVPTTVTANPESVTVEYGNTAYITLTLETGVKASFATDPVVWDGGTAPQGVVVTRVSNTVVTIVESDFVSSTTDYSFQAVVAYNGADYLSPDPVIINKGHH